VALMVLPAIGLGDEEVAYRIERLWPTLQQPWYFVRPTDVALHTRGKVYVADSGQVNTKGLEMRLIMEHVARRSLINAPFTTLFVLTCMLALVAAGRSWAASPLAGADETTPSKAMYFDWINIEWHGGREEKVLRNLEFFEWLRAEYGMQLDIYLMDAATLDKGPGCSWGEPDLQGIEPYRDLDAPDFRAKFPDGFDAVCAKARSFDCGMGIWLGPDGFGQTEADAQNRVEMLVKFCRDYQMALFKFDSCCSNLREDKQQYFIEAMTQCREHCPGLIALNHRINFNDEALKHLTTWLWEGAETYVDVAQYNQRPAPHHRLTCLSRGLPPELQRLTEDCGVCLSSYLDYWDDDLVLQAFNRCLILAPEIYGNPWFLRDDEFAKLARIYNLHRRYRDILVNGTVLPRDRYGEHAVSRGDGKTRFVTLRNLTWNPARRTIKLDKSIGLEESGDIELRQLHPTEKVLGVYRWGAEVSVEVLPFRACLLMATTADQASWAITGSDYEVVRDVPGKPVVVNVLGMPGRTVSLGLMAEGRTFTKATLSGEDISQIVQGAPIAVTFPGQPLRHSYHRKLATLSPADVPRDEERVFEAVCFAADSDALEVRSLRRSGPTLVPAVQAARDAFFEDPVFIEKGGWDRFAFDGDTKTAFKVRRYGSPFRYSVSPGVFRMDFGCAAEADEIRLTGLARNYVPRKVEVSLDLNNWTQVPVARRADTLKIDCRQGAFRYLRINKAPLAISEITAVRAGRELDRSQWRASNLFRRYRKRAKQAWSATIRLDEIPKNSYLAVAVPGDYGTDGAVAALRIGDELIGAPDRAPCYPSNHWEHSPVRANGNYTFNIPLSERMQNESIEVLVLGLNDGMASVQPDVWLTAYPIPFESKILRLE